MLEHIIPYVKKQRQNLSLDPQYPTLLIMDVFKGQMVKQVKYLLNENNIKQGYGIFFGGVSRYCTWAFCFKDYKTAIQISSKKRKFKRFRWLAPQETENILFWKMDKKSQVSRTTGNKPKIIEFSFFIYVTSD